MEGGVFAEEEVRAVKGEVAVYFVGPDLVKSFDSVLPAGVHQDAGAYDVCLQKDRGVFYGAVNVAFGSEVYDYIRVFCFKDGIDAVPVADVFLVEGKVGMCEGFLQGVDVGSIGQGVHAYNVPLGAFFKEQVDKVAAYKAGTARYKYFHFGSSVRFPVSGHVLFIQESCGWSDCGERVSGSSPQFIQKSGACHHKFHTLYMKCP